MNRMLLLICLTLFSSLCLASDKTVIRIGVLASGTLAWELAAMQNEGLLENDTFSVETVPLANPQAGKVAFQAGSVDIVISDWIWVSSMRAQGSDYTFYPYSASAGGLLVPADSQITKLSDLQNKKLGIAGGELDKNWSLLQALGLKQNIDLSRSVEKVFAAPPILNQQLSAKRIDALLTYWQFAARLEAEGYRQLMSGEDIIRALGIKETVPSLGYVFRQSWADQHKDALQQFLSGAQTAKDNLCNSEQSWQKIADLTQTSAPGMQMKIRARYCEGRIKQWNGETQKAANTIFDLLSQSADNKLTGKAAHLQPGTFWSAD